MRVEFFFQEMLYKMKYTLLRLTSLLYWVSSRRCDHFLALFGCAMRGRVRK
jgi:hypothetical protein